MALNDLTSPHAVRQALEEFEQLGRSAFLTKYGFGQAREYFVRSDGKMYDSKAVVGAAYGYQYPDRGPLKAIDFSGGEATVQAKLEELGFEVVVVGNELPAAPSLELEKAFHRRMIEIYKHAKAIGYNASRFLGMVNDHGGLETARILLRSPTVSDGYTALWERGRLDLTVEAMILEARWAALFTEADRRIAVTRLRQYGYEGELPA
jgi:hypothetical protein